MWLWSLHPAVVQHKQCAVGSSSQAWQHPASALTFNHVLSWVVCWLQTSIGCGFVWRRRPIRWLKGLGGQLDFTYDVFLHERDTEKVRPLRAVGACTRGVLLCRENLTRVPVQTGRSNTAFTYLIVQASQTRRTSQHMTSHHEPGRFLTPYQWSHGMVG